MGHGITGILFDKDGTLFDFRRTWAGWARQFLLELCEGDTARARAMGAHLGYDLDTGSFDGDSGIIAGSPHDVALMVQQLVPDLDIPAFVSRFNVTAAQAPVAEPVPLAPLLGGFRGAGITLGVATNDSEAAARAHLDRVGVTALFDFIAGFDSGYGAKPEPGMQHAFCARFGLAPGSVVMVGDSVHDLESGRAAGMRTVAVLTGIATEAELAPLADAVLPHVGYLPEWIEAQGG